MKIADAMLIGGGMAYTFLKAEGQPIGKSLIEDDKVDLAKRLRAEAQQKKFEGDRKSTRLNSSHTVISYAVFCLKKKKHNRRTIRQELLMQLCALMGMASGSRFVSETVTEGAQIQE